MTNSPASEMELIERLREIRGRLEKATKVAPEPWHYDTVHCEGDYGSGPNPSHGYDAFQVIALVDGKWQSVVDTLNSDLTIVHEDYDDDSQKNAWDESARNIIPLIAHAPSDIRFLLDALSTARKETWEEAAKHLETLSKAAGERRKEYYAERLLDAALKYSHQEDNLAEAAQALRSRASSTTGRKDDAP